MRKRTFVTAMALGLAAVLAVGGLYASNMGFKLNYTLQATTAGVSKSGQTTLALPDNRQTGLGTANQLMTDITFANTQSVARWLEASDSFQAYTGRKGNVAPDFPLVTGDGYMVKMSTTTNYIVVGSHDPAFTHSLNAAAAGTSKSGQNFFAYPYHSTATTAKTLMDDIGFANVQSVARWLKASDSFQAYTGRKGNVAPDFSLVPGEAYIVKMSTAVNYIPSHY
jgi:hypothetical protein